MIRHIDSLFPQVIQRLNSNPFHFFEIFDLDDFESNESNKGYSFVADDNLNVKEYLELLGFKSVKSTNELFEQCYCFVYNRLCKSCVVRVYLSSNFDHVTNTLDYLRYQKDHLKTPMERYDCFKRTLNAYMNK